MRGAVWGAEGTLAELRNTTLLFVPSLGGLLRIKSLRGKGYPKRILVCEKIGSDTFRSKTSLQLRLPVWQCYTESLHQAGVRKN